MLVAPAVAARGRDVVAGGWLGRSPAARYGGRRCGGDAAARRGLVIVFQHHVVDVAEAVLAILRARAPRRAVLRLAVGVVFRFACVQAYVLAVAADSGGSGERQGGDHEAHLVASVTR